MHWLSVHSIQKAAYRLCGQIFAETRINVWIVEWLHYECWVEGLVSSGNTMRRCTELFTTSLHWLFSVTTNCMTKGIGIWIWHNYLEILDWLILWLSYIGKIVWYETKCAKSFGWISGTFHNVYRSFKVFLTTARM